MFSPCFAVPRPSGRPAPSGGMLMSQGAMSAGPIGCPKRGACEKTGVAASKAAHTVTRSSIDIARLPLLINSPARDGVVVIDTAQAALGSKGSACRLHHAGVVGGTALQYRGAAIPLPRRTESHCGL